MTKSVIFLISLILGALSGFAQDIDLSNWKITIPEGDPSEVEPPEIFDFENNEILKPFFYKDEIDNAFVFYAYPAQTTRNTKYSRSELREQMEPGSNSVNWKFEDGALMRGTLSVPSVSQDNVGNYHRVIIMQIHGRLTNEQRDLIGEDDNNAPPILKIYWDEGKIRVKTKVLKNKDATDEEILHEKAWGDDKGRNFKEIVGTSKFTLEVRVSKGKMLVSLNDKETFEYSGIDIDRWNIFENYFKAGNYFQSRDEGSYAKVKYYALDVAHGSDVSSYVPKYILQSEEYKSNTANKLDLTNWKLELPTGYKADGWKLSNYRNDVFAKPFIFYDDEDSALVVKAFPAEGTSTAKYIRATLREQIVPGNSNVNWSLKTGGVLEAEFKVDEISRSTGGESHSTILFQIDGITTSKQNEDLGLEKSIGIPLLKIYWQDNKLFIKRKILKDESIVGDALLNKDSWKEDEGTYSRAKFENERVKIKIEVKKDKIVIYINDEKPIVYRDLSMTQWYFDNYFTVGNYLQTKDENASCTVRFYKIKVSHGISSKEKKKKNRK